MYNTFICWTVFTNTFLVSGCSSALGKKEKNTYKSGLRLQVSVKQQQNMHLKSAIASHLSTVGQVRMLGSTSGGSYHLLTPHPTTSVWVGLRVSAGAYTEILGKRQDQMGVKNCRGPGPGKCYFVLYSDATCPASFLGVAAMYVVFGSFTVFLSCFMSYLFLTHCGEGMAMSF